MKVLILKWLLLTLCILVDSLIHGQFITTERARLSEIDDAANEIATDTPDVEMSPPEDDDSNSLTVADQASMDTPIDQKITTNGETLTPEDDELNSGSVTDNNEISIDTSTETGIPTDENMSDPEDDELNSGSVTDNDEVSTDTSTETGIPTDEEMSAAEDDELNSGADIVTDQFSTDDIVTDQFSTDSQRETGTATEEEISAANDYELNSGADIVTNNVSDTPTENEISTSGETLAAAEDYEFMSASREKLNTSSEKGLPSLLNILQTVGKHPLFKPVNLILGVVFGRDPSTFTLLDADENATYSRNESLFDSVETDSGKIMDVRRSGGSLLDEYIHQQSHSTSVVKKCCELGEVLNEYYRCQKSSETSQYFLPWVNDISDREISRDQVESLNSFLCSAKVIKEYVPSFISTENKSIETQDGGVLENNEYYCMDVTHWLHDDPDGLHVITCGNENQGGQEEGFITKCCALNQLLSYNLDRCVELPDNVSPMGWIPPRHILSPDTLTATGAYHTRYPNISLFEEGRLLISKMYQHLLANGQAVFDLQSRGMQGYFVDNYVCVDRILMPGDGVSDPVPIIFEETECSENEICIEKCCPENYIFEPEIMECRASDKSIGMKALLLSNIFTVKKMEEYGLRSLSEEEIVNDYNVTTRNNFIFAEDCEVLFPEDGVHEFTLLTNGSLIDSDKWMTELYCVESITEPDPKNPNHTIIVPGIITCKIYQRSGPYIFDLIPEASGEGSGSGCPATYNLIPLFTFIGVVSVIFLILTTVVYLTLPSLRKRSLHGNIVLSNTSSMLMMTIYILIVYNTRLTLKSNYCIFMGYFGYMAAMSNFLWMTVMCGDLFWTFYRATRSSKHSDSFKIKVYSLVAWGTALFLTILMLICQYGTKSDSVWNPKIGYRKCFIDPEGITEGLFFHLPIVLLMVLNVILFSITVHRLRLHSANCADVRSSKRKSGSVRETEEGKRKSRLKPLKRIGEDTREQVVLFGKMFLVLGVLWICESFHYFSHMADTEKCHPINFFEIFFRFVDAFNLLRGAFFFIIFVCKATVWKEIKQMRAYKYLFSRIELRSVPGRKANSTFFPSLTSNTNSTVLSSQSSPKLVKARFNSGRKTGAEENLRLKAIKNIGELDFKI